MVFGVTGRPKGSSGVTGHGSKFNDRRGQTAGFGTHVST